MVSGARPINPDLSEHQIKEYQQSQKNAIIGEMEQLQAQSAAQMRRLMGTEIVIERVMALKELDTDPWDDLGNW